MLLYQTHNSIGEDIYNAFLYSNPEWLIHFHKSFELAVVIEGDAVATVDGVDYNISKGQAVLITPYLLHSYSTPKNCKLFVVVFSSSYTENFARLTQNKRADNPVIDLDELTWRIINEKLLGEVSLGDKSHVSVAKPHVYDIKSALYAICALMVRSTSFTARNSDGKLVFEILQYVENNFMQDITLNSLAFHLGYDYSYVSRIFSANIKVNFKTLVNQYRCDYAKNLIVTTSKDFADIAYQSGFQSIRSFNRAFKLVTGHSPSHYRK
ncbi:MAG: helix-turn-helix domain-containing protein [Clostridia bacterium]|nr:helix-turn-helix domain-containing protein [Clostridia bacterium]